MKSRYIIIAAVVIFLLGALSGGLLQHSWDMRQIDRVDTVTVWKPASLDTSSMVATTKPAPPSAPPVVIPSDRIEKSEDTTSVRIRPEIVSVSGSLSGGLTYQAELTGVKPAIQALQVNYPETTVTTTLSKPYRGWMLSATTAGAAYAAPQLTTFSTVAIETSYNVGRLHIGLQGGVAHTWSPGGQQLHPYLGGRVTIDLFRMK